ncbi:protein import receptor MAS20 [Coprinopsis sp. MPI-PUGE-AT-0042]|nr:protein import receptor MAS20 [Coprinopsis sp. MPI-PUGE-AT-0042]
MDASSRSTVIAAVAVVATGVLAYAVYFDYKRRNDVEFRRKLKKEKKRVNKAAAQAQPSEEAGLTVSPEMLREAMEAIKNEPVVPIEQREGYFMSQVSMGEQLASQGPTFHLPAAIAFFRALRIYPAPAELIGIYENTVPAPVFKLVVQMTNMDVSSSPSSPVTKSSRIVNDDIDDDSSPTRSQASSQEWEKVADPESQE